MTHASGEKCATQLFMEMHVGNASPARWGESKTKRKREIKINQFDRQLVFGVGMEPARTFGDFDSFDRLVVHRAGALLDELIALDTETEDICALHR